MRATVDLSRCNREARWGCQPDLCGAGQIFVSLIFVELDRYHSLEVSSSILAVTGWNLNLSCGMMIKAKISNPKHVLKGNFSSITGLGGERN